MASTSFKSIAKDFGEDTSVHGIKYVTRSGYSKIAWVLVIISGLISAGLVINEAFIEWNAHKVLTTLDSVAAPISEIQFPTVTICPDDATLPDSWSLVSYLLNFLAFECYEEKSRQYPDCNLTQSLRQDYNDLITNIVDVVSSAVEKAHIEGNIDEKTAYAKQMAALTLRLIDMIHDTEGPTGNSSQLLDELSQRLLVQEFGQYIQQDIFYRGKLSDILDDIANASSTSSSPIFDSVENCTQSENCTRILEQIQRFMVKLTILIPKSREVPFGYLLRTFARLQGTLLSPLPYDRYSADFLRSKQHFTCDSTLEGQAMIKIHDLAKQLAKGMGIPNASLLELPQMLGPLTPDILVNKAANFFTSPYLSCSMENWNSLRYCMQQRWEPYMEYPGTKPHPCDIDDNLCCHSTADPERIGANLTLIMNIMKYATRSVVSTVKVETLANLLNPDAIPYPVFDKDQGYFGGGKPEVYNPNNMIPHCKLGTRIDILGFSFKPECRDFKPVITDKGICYSFNAESFIKVTRASKFKDAFTEAYKEELKGSQDEIKKNTGYGPSFGLHLWLDNQAVPFKQTGQPSTFVIGISNKRGFVDMQASSQRISLGTKTVIEVEAEALESADDLRSLPVSERQCRFENELPEDGSMKLFKTYSQDSCKFECMLRYSTEMCRCVPWQYPDVVGNSAMCDSVSHYCFSIHMKNVSQLSNCDCPMDCNRLSFSYRWMETTIDSDLKRLCTFGTGYRYTFAKLNRNYPEIFRAYDTFVLNVTYMPKVFSFDRLAIVENICESMMATSIADVKIIWSRSYYTKYRQDLRVTFVDRIASFGGTLGLFTGMSFLSMFELVYWSLLAIRKLLLK